MEKAVCRTAFEAMQEKPFLWGHEKHRGTGDKKSVVRAVALLEIFKGHKDGDKHTKADNP